MKNVAVILTDSLTLGQLGIGEHQQCFADHQRVGEG